MIKDLALGSVKVCDFNFQHGRFDQASHFHTYHGAGALGLSCKTHHSSIGCWTLVTTSRYILRGSMDTDADANANALRILLDAKVIATASCLAFVWMVYLLLRPDPEAAVDFALPAPSPCSPGWKGQALDRPSIKVPGSSAIQCYSPLTGEYLGLVNPSTPDRIDRIISRAAVAQKSWSQSTFAQRRKVLKTLLKFILDNQESIIRAACLDSGKTRVDALFGEVLVTAEKIKWTITHGENALRPDRRPTNLLMFYKVNEIIYEPLGVVAACVSWK